MVQAIRTNSCPGPDFTRHGSNPRRNSRARPDDFLLSDDEHVRERLEARPETGDDWRRPRQSMRTSHLVAALVVGTLGVVPSDSAAQQVRPRVSAHYEQGRQALEEHRYGDALEAFTAAATADPREAPFAFGAGASAYMLGQLDLARTWLEKTLALRPSYTDASLLLGETEYAIGDLAAAVATYEAALKHAPSNARLRSRLTEWRNDAQATSGFYRAQGAHFTVMFEGAADDALARRAVEVLETAYWRVGNRLSVYPQSAVTVILYTQQQFRDITRSPGWAGGIYDGRIRVPMQGALNAPADLERVLAHEYVHAVVAALGGRRVPVWVNEGLATVLEPGGPEWTEQLLAQTDVRVPLHVLQQSFGGLNARQAGLAYAESAAAVQKLLDIRGAPAIVALLRAVAEGVAFETAFHQNVAIRLEDFEATLR